MGPHPRRTATTTTTAAVIDSIAFDSIAITERWLPPPRSPQQRAKKYILRGVLRGGLFYPLLGASRPPPSLKEIC